ncbi:protein phosphatase 1D [Hydra vulgaris]|uniref:Protein phosphatase 1D n=1 Tax=Hydra vulgaris TaxID=6087 RepID=A0ABM4CNQ2_HYDVU
MPFNSSINCLRISSDKHRGMRNYMEDELRVKIEENNGKKTYFLGVFDGHGGGEASVYARSYLYNKIIEQPGFHDDDPCKVKDAIRDGFIKTHWEMYRIADTWPKRRDGSNSTSGTTATVAIIKDNKLYIAHVGDSGAAIAYKSGDDFVSKELTIDHKPENLKERSRIENLGGKVSTSGVPRVVWKRPLKNPHYISSENSVTQHEYIPFLAVARALGDFWSFDPERNEFIVSPEPDIKCLDIVPDIHKFLILASDGLWGVMNAKQAVDIVTNYERNADEMPLERNCATVLCNQSLEFWKKRRSRADNISAVVLFFDEEFGSCDPLYYDSENSTLSLEDGEDTPPLFDALPPVLVRNLDFQEIPLSARLPVKILSGSSQKRNYKHKRKHEDDHKGSKLKYVKIGVDDNIKTDVSPESLNELQLDEMFADDENEDASSAKISILKPFLKS